jgi:dynein heavy chain
MADPQGARTESRMLMVTGSMRTVKQRVSGCTLRCSHAAQRRACAHTRAGRFDFHARMHAHMPHAGKPAAEGEQPAAEEPDSSPSAAAAAAEAEAALAQGQAHTEGEEPAVDGGEAPAEGTEGPESSPAPAATSSGPQYITVLVPKEVNRLHINLGCVPEELSQCRSLYFVRTRNGKLDLEDLDSSLDLGMLGEGPSLRMLEQTLSSVFMPMLMQMTGMDAASAGNVLLGANSSATSSHRELLGNMQKFLSQVSHALQQLNGDITLPVSFCFGGN